jgi:hypothetical protein
MSGRFEFLYALGFGSPDCERRQFHLIEKQRPLQYSRSANIQVNRTCSKGREPMDKLPRRTNNFGLTVELILPTSRFAAASDNDSNSSNSVVKPFSCKVLP